MTGEKETSKIKRKVFGLLRLIEKEEHNRGCEIDEKEEERQRVLLPFMASWHTYEQHLYLEVFLGRIDAERKNMDVF